MVTKGLHIPSGTTLAQFGAAVEAEAPELFTGPFSWPVMTIDVDALEHNLSGMAQFCARNGFALAPHVKTHMSRELWDRQRDAGAWGPTVANATQLRTVLDWGARQILVANQMLDPRDLTHLAQLAGRAGGSDPLQVWVYADSRAGVEVLARHLAAPGVREHIGVLVELGHAGGRTGARTVDEVVAVARAADAAGLRVVGVSAYEGSIGFGAAPAELEAVGRFCTDLLTAAEAI